ncbi:hypothetical protein ACFQGT_11820 [Natrialbaceae archaeon GCM10025810]|uniref:hypothetical protein n=1 Tax=Halovalidus salilacus TaxID=3075124 RepID=UPI003612BC4A
MNRRTLLATVGATVGIAGCTENLQSETFGDDSTDQDDYEQCDEEILLFEHLPDDVKTEVETAFEEGEYRTDGELLYEQVASSNVEALRRNDLYWEAHVDERLLPFTKTTLSFTQTTIRYDSTIDLEIRNASEEEWTESILVRNVDEEILVHEEDVTIDPYPIADEEKEDVRADDKRIATFPVSKQWGRYKILLAYEDDPDTPSKDTWLDTHVGKYERRYLRVVVSDGDAEFDNYFGGKSPEEDQSSPEIPCWWNEDGEI